MKFLISVIIFSYSTHASLLGLQNIKNVNQDFSSGNFQSDDFLFFNYIEHRFQKIIEEENPDYLSSLSQKDLKNSAKEVSYLLEVICRDFKIEKLLLLGLIERESFFRANAISPTGAVGLTQMTKWGIAEVLHQLGVIPNQADKKAVEVFRRYYNRVNQNLISKYKLPSISSFSKYPSSTWSNTKTGIKKMLISNPALSIVFGAIFMKALIAKNCKTDVCLEEFQASRTGHRASTAFAKEIYEQALISYNGDTTPIKNCSGFSLPNSQLQEKYCYAKKVVSVSSKAVEFLSDKYEDYLQVKSNLSSIAKNSYYISL